jgi:hypothetical protein
MSVLALDLALVRDVLLPGLTLTPGRALMARVVDAPPGGGRGSVAIAGFLVDAELPDGLQAGADLRLVVRDLDAQRVTLQITPQAHSAPAPETPVPASPGAVPLPGEMTLRVADDAENPAPGGGGNQPGRHALALSLDTGALGTLDLRFTLDPATLSVTVALAPGPGLDRARAATGELRDAIVAQTGRPASVAVISRRRPLDLYA